MFPFYSSDKFGVPISLELQRFLHVSDLCLIIAMAIAVIYFFSNCCSYAFSQNKGRACKAFFIGFEMSTTTKSLSASYMVVVYGAAEKTASVFMMKIGEAMSSSGKNPMDGIVHVAEFFVGGKENGKVGRSYDAKKKKAVSAAQLTQGGKEKRRCAMKIDNFSARSSQYFFGNELSRLQRYERTTGKDIDLQQRSTI